MSSHSSSRSEEQARPFFAPTFSHPSFSSLFTPLFSYPPPSHPPIRTPLVSGTIASSWLVPPLLAPAYALLGAILPAAFERALGTGGLRSATERPPAGLAAALAVSTTLLIIKTSEVLLSSPLPAAPSLAALSALCAAQWLALDGRWASLALALAAAALGPLAELPLLSAGCWHYLHPDYFPLEIARDSFDSFDSVLGSTLGGFGGGEAAEAGRGLGLHSITAPCYFAVATDAIAVGRWLGGGADGAGDRRPQPGATQV